MYQGNLYIFWSKRAVAQALKAQGKDYGKITVKTGGPKEEIAYLEPVNTDIVIVGGDLQVLQQQYQLKKRELKI